jgi:HD-GYP domain-containing protein (c-di-GMP phosphodiesterase class II)
MLKRIALVGDDAAQAAAAQQHLEGCDACVVAVAPGGALPPGTGAVVTAAGLAAGLDAALAICTQQETLLVLLSEAIGAREGHRPGSARRMLEHASRFAKALGLDAEETSRLERAALLRGLGKLRIDNDVLLKKSVLDYDEWLMIQRHPALGAGMLQELQFSDDIAEVVHAHHECYDGTGYPDCLERAAIPVLARALKLLDVFCAMTSPRHYRSGHATVEQALEHLQSERGKHFDPDLVGAFIHGGVGQAWDAAS